MLVTFLRNFLNKMYNYALNFWFIGRHWKYSGFPKVVARKGLKNAKFQKVVAFAQPKLVARKTQLLLETYYIFTYQNQARRQTFYQTSKKRN